MAKSMNNPTPIQIITVGFGLRRHILLSDHCCHYGIKDPIINSLNFWCEAQHATARCS